MVVDAGLVLWFKFFSDPKMQSILMQEEEDSVRRNLSITEAAIRGLAKGNLFFLKKKTITITITTNNNNN